MVAIVGASGSGKSTLMNILGCLDRPTAGTYRSPGATSQRSTPDELAALRREHFGFIFQRYHLLADLTRSTMSRCRRSMPASPRRRARDAGAGAADRLGLGDRLDAPARASSPAASSSASRRAGADEWRRGHPRRRADRRARQPQRRGADALLEELQRRGPHHHHRHPRHEGRGAGAADHRDQRRRDRRRPRASAGAARRRRRERGGRRRGRRALARGRLDRLGEAFAHGAAGDARAPLRTFLTMLGIIIGIASVVSVVALGQGTQQPVLANIVDLGTNTIDIYPGTGLRRRALGPDPDAGAGRRRRAGAAALCRQRDADGVRPTPRCASAMSRPTRRSTASASDYLRRHAASTLAERRGFFDATARADARAGRGDRRQRRATRCSPTARTRSAQVILVGTVPVRVIGVVEPQPGLRRQRRTSASTCPTPRCRPGIPGDTSLRSITVRVARRRRHGRGRSRR